MQSTKQTRRSILINSALLAGTIVGCTKPNPNDPTHIVVASWVSRARNIITSIRNVSHSSVRILESINVIPHSVMQVIRIGYDVLDESVNALESSLNTYEANGGDSCMVYSMAMGVKTAIISLARMLVRYGFWIGIPMEAVADSVFSLIDTLLNRCEEDAGFFSFSSHGNSELRQIQESTTIHLRNDLDRATQ